MAKRRTTAARARTRRPAPRKREFFPGLKRPEFRPDTQGSGMLKKLYMTRQQRFALLRWVLYAAVCVVLLVIQDVIMSQVRIFGATTDLAVCPILLITVMAGSEVGSVFVLVASTLYYFSGSAPGPYCVAFLTVLGVLASLFRQQYWHRSMGSIVLCSGLALELYEICTFAAGIFLGLTRWNRFSVFAMTGLLSCVTLVPLYSLINLIGKIGGNTWKE